MVVGVVFWTPRCGSYDETNEAPHSLCSASRTMPTFKSSRLKLCLGACWRLLCELLRAQVCGSHRLPC